MSDLKHPNTDEEVDAANKADGDQYLAVKCHVCGDVEPCFNRSQVAWTKTCFPCLMGWTRKPGSLKEAS